MVGAAVFVPLAAGVLGAKQLSVHPNFRPGVRETGRTVELTEGATCHHKALSSAVSPTAAIRMMVELVGARDGEFTRATLTKYLGLSDPDEDIGVAEHWRYKRLAQGKRDKGPVAVAQALLARAKALDVEVPLTEALVAIYGGMHPLDAVSHLMARQATAEHR